MKWGLWALSGLVLAGCGAVEQAVGTAEQGIAKLEQGTAKLNEWQAALGEFQSTGNPVADARALTERYRALERLTRDTTSQLMSDPELRKAQEQIRQRWQTMQQETKRFAERGGDWSALQQRLRDSLDQSKRELDRLIEQAKQRNLDPAPLQQERDAVQRELEALTAA